MENLKIMTVELNVFFVKRKLQNVVKSPFQKTDGMQGNIEPCRDFYHLYSLKNHFFSLLFHLPAFFLVVKHAFFII